MKEASKTCKNQTVGSCATRCMTSASSPQGNEQDMKIGGFTHVQSLCQVVQCMRPHGEQTHSHDCEFRKVSIHCTRRLASFIHCTGPPSSCASSTSDAPSLMVSMSSARSVVSNGNTPSTYMFVYTSVSATNSTALSHHVCS